MRILSRFNIRRAAVLGAASIWLALMVAVAPAADQTGQGSTGESARVVLLKNDHCLTGLVRQLGDQVVIEISPDARVCKLRKDVEFIADDLEGAYRHKLTRFSRLGPGEHMHLARWCLSVGLNELAANHFLAVNKEAGANPLVKQLGVELREQLLKDEAFRSYLGLAPLPSPRDPELEVQVASTSGAGADAPLLPTVLATFTDHIQPILLNRCSQSGCHGLSASNKLKIIQPLGTSRARISEQNCRSAMQFVDPDQSGMSTLLRYAMTTHGIDKRPSITTDEIELIRKLQSWTAFARNPVMAAVGGASANPSSAGAVQAMYTGQGPTAAQVHSGSQVGVGVPGVAGLTPVDPRAAQLRSVPRRPKFGVQPYSDGPSPSELDELEDQLRRALGEPPRSAVPIPVVVPSPAPLPATPASAQATPGGSSQNSAGASTASANSAPAADPFDPAEFNRRVAEKSQR